MQRVCSSDIVYYFLDYLLLEVAFYSLPPLRTRPLTGCASDFCVTEKASLQGHIWEGFHYHHVKFHVLGYQQHFRLSMLDHSFDIFFIALNCVIFRQKYFRPGLVSESVVWN